MYQAKFNKLTLHFKTPSGTSRGILNSKDSWILSLWSTSNSKIVGKGEASIIKSLSPDWSEQYEDMILSVAKNIDHYINHLEELNKYPSIQLAIETALKDVESGGVANIFQPEAENIPINGLVWMGTKDFMLKQVKQKIAEGFNTIKLKIGAINFEEELAILAYIRQQYSEKEITIRLDANGAFDASNALNKLKKLSKFDIHSIEQPIMAKQWEAMAALCKTSPIPIALDEELIGIISYGKKVELLKKIQPQYIILKPSLIGGFSGSDQWIKIAEQQGIKWWITSALESNIGLNAIAQYTATKNNILPQGLGTGGLFTNNIEPYLKVKNGYLWL